MNNEYSPLENFLNVPMIDYYRKHPEEFMEEILKLELYQKEMTSLQKLQDLMTKTEMALLWLKVLAY